MIKCFLSHSSEDKNTYVRLVAEKVKITNCIYDEYTFEEGMKPLDEIMDGLNESDLFVIFLSEFSLKSKWVQFEITEAKKKLDSNKLRKIFPIVIDKQIHYSDKRIPQWMKDEYNLKYVSRPVVAARRIRQRLREISWSIHPNLKSKIEGFVGRNSLVNEFEERIDDFDLPKPTCIIASGVPSYGRRSLLEYCSVKTGLFEESYRPPYIYLNSEESVEDFILKIYDLGFSLEKKFTNFMTTTIREKVQAGINLVGDLHSIKETVFIIDNGCIVNYKRNICEWFVDIVDAVGPSELLTFCVVSRFRPDINKYRHNNHFYCIGVPELSFKERKGLLKRYSISKGLDLIRDDLNYFSNLLSGYPEQVFFVVNQIIEEGLANAKKDTNLIVEYNSLKVQILLKRWEDNEEIINFLRLLSEFQFISHDLVYDIVNDSDVFRKAIDTFRGLSIVELIGANKENIRVVDNVRDYIKRQKINLKDEYKDKLTRHVKDFLSTYKDEEKDLSDFLFSMQSALKTGCSIDEQYLIPSHFMKTIKELYDNEKKYEEVVSLSDRVLNSNQYIDGTFLQNVRYYLCLALARLRNSRCVKEAQAFRGHQHNFILGFYYRLKGRYSDAIIRLESALAERQNSPRAKRELVLVFQYIGEYELAFELAKQNYENDKFNPYHIQAYLNCLLKDLENKEAHQGTIEMLLSALEIINSETAHEMFLTAKAEFLAFHLNQELPAIEIITEAKELYPTKIYPKLMQFDIHLKFNDVENMKSSLQEINDMVDGASYFFNSYIRRQCVLIAKTESFDAAKTKMDRYLSNYTDRAKERFERLLFSCSQGNSNGNYCL